MRSTLFNIAIKATTLLVSGVLLFPSYSYSQPQPIGGIVAMAPIINQPTKVFLPAPSGQDSAPALQALIDSLPQVTDIFSGQGGGKIVFPRATITLFTNIVIPNYFPFCFEMEGAGAMGNTVFYMKNTHQNKAKGYFTCATNFTRFALTNSMRLDVHGCAFVQEDMLSTNFIFNVEGGTWCHIHDNLFTTAYGLTNGQGAYTLSWEANVPNQPIGCAGISAYAGADGTIGSGANALFYCDHNIFYCLANAIVCGATITRIDNNYFSCIGMYNTDGPPNGSSHDNIHFATNLWSGVYADTLGIPMSSGAAIIGFNWTDSAMFSQNEFYACGIVCYGTGISRWYENRMSVCGWRFADDDQGVVLGCHEMVIDGEPGSGNPGSFVTFNDVQLTNSADSKVLQPDGPHVGSALVPHTRPASSPTIYIRFDDSSGNQYHSFSGGPVWMTNGFAVGTGGGTWATNSTAPSVNNAIKAWLSITNDSGKVGKIPVYY